MKVTKQVRHSELAPGRVIAGFALGHELNDGQSEAEKQENVDVTAFVQHEFEDKPKHQK